MRQIAVVMQHWGMRFLLIKSQREDARERAAADPDAAILETARAALEDQVKAAKTDVDRENAKRRLLLFVKQHAQRRLE
jgi:hypothetical protein